MISHFDHLRRCSFERAPYRERRFQQPSRLCELCAQRIAERPYPGSISEGYVTLSRYSQCRWICPSCFVSHASAMEWSLLPAGESLSIPAPLNSPPPSSPSIGLWTLEELECAAQDAGLALPFEVYRTLLEWKQRALQFHLAELLQAHYAVPASTPPPTRPAESPSFLDRLHGRSWQHATYRPSRFSLPAVFCEICGTTITAHPGPHDVDRGFAALLRVAIYTHWEWVCVRCFERYQQQADWSTAPREDPRAVPPLPAFPFNSETLTAIAGQLGLSLSQEQAEAFFQQHMPRLLRHVDHIGLFLLQRAAKSS